MFMNVFIFVSFYDARKAGKKTNMPGVRSSEGGHSGKSEWDV